MASINVIAPDNAVSADRRVVTNCFRRLTPHSCARASAGHALTADADLLRRKLGVNAECAMVPREAE